MQRLGRLVGLCVLLASAVGAEEVPTPERRGPCAANLHRFCKDTAPGDGRLRACLDAHEAELPAECRALLPAKSKAGAAAPAMDARQLLACRHDLRTHCGKVPSGGGRLRACLNARETQLTSRCSATLARPVNVRTTK